jgi:hypothetical protein
MVGFDGVAQLDRCGRRGHPAERSGSVQQVPQRRGVEGFPAPFAVRHVAQVGDQHVIVGFRIARPRGGVPGAGPDQSVCRAPSLAAAPPAASNAEPGVEVGQGGVGFGVQDGVHVVAAADQTQQRHRLLGLCRVGDYAE